MRYLRTWKTWRAAARSEEGQGLVEYALVLALVSIVAITGLISFSTSVQTFLDQTNNTLETVLKTHGHCGHKACK